MNDLSEKLAAIAKHYNTIEEIREDIMINNPNGRSYCGPLKITYVNIWEPSELQKKELEEDFGDVDKPFTDSDHHKAFIIGGLKFVFECNSENNS